jgi:DNA-binding MarR family transcriptional regulator
MGHDQGMSGRPDPIKLAMANWESRGWDDEVVGMAVVTSVMRVWQLLNAQVEAALRPLDLTFSRFEVLMLLSFSRTGALPVGKVGERLQVHPASVTNAVERLEREGLVERRPNPNDRRGVLAVITEAGRRRADEASDVVNRTVFGALPLDRADQEALVRLLERMRHAFGDFDRAREAGDGQII